ncbi:hypothetical protein [Acidovorax sp. T1]|uniref:hypothetical protein n=2 Tax=unclassified Acidovorax TaxID=2684926 RepID=UPI0011781DE4|nr:hypothetical protein [Acidovorax sp. T1]
MHCIIKIDKKLLRAKLTTNQIERNMFDLFKKKSTTTSSLRLPTKDEQFNEELVLFGSRFSGIIRHIDPSGEEEMLRRAYDDYYMRSDELAGFGAADLYMHEFAHLIFEATDNSELNPRHSLQFYVMVDSFLDNFPFYRTQYVMHIMNLWHEKLTKHGVI